MARTLTCHFRKTFPNGSAVVSADLEIGLEPATVTVLFGPSGGGKTTILRTVAGLERADSGSISYAGEAWMDTARGLFIPPQQRRIGFLFQDYALFPHLSVAGNIRYGMRHLARSEQDERVTDLLTRFKLEGLPGRFPDQLSGGEKQRVALARTLASQPRVLLLDEPLSALDAPTRDLLRGELRGLLRSLGVPVLLVTHDRVEALTLADDIAVVCQGEILEHGAVEEVFQRPRSQAVARIVGVETVRPGRIVKNEAGLTIVAVGDTQLTAVAPDLISNARDVFVCIRAEDVVLLKGESTQSASPRNRCHAVVRSLTREGPMFRIDLDAGFPLTALLTRQACEELSLSEGEKVIVLIKAPNVHLIPRGA